MRALESRHDSQGFGMAAVLNRGEATSGVITAPVSLWLQ